MFELSASSAPDGVTHRYRFDPGHPLGATASVYTGGAELRAESHTSASTARDPRESRSVGDAAFRGQSEEWRPALRKPSLMAELNDADLLAEAETEPGRARPHRWTQEEAREAARLSRESRATRRDRTPPSDEDIERGLRERAVSDPRAAEILLRWQQRPRPASDGDELEGLTVEQLEALYAALLRLSALTPEEQSAVVQGLLDGRV